MNCRVLLAWALACLVGVAPSRADDWPQWRGPSGDATSGERGLPAEWDPSTNIAWKLTLPGEGSSTPAVVGQRIFLTVQEAAPARNLLVCVGTDGKERWRHDLGPAQKPWGRGPEGNNATPSPSTDGKAVYAFVGNGTFAAFTLDGKELWRFDVQKRYGKFRIQFGMHSTPVLYSGRLYFQLIHDNAAAVVCVDAGSGKEVWKADRRSDGVEENRHSYASAVLWKKGDDAYLVCHGNDYATAHALADGKEIWRVGDLNPRDHYNNYLRFVASPGCSADLIVVPSAKNGPVVGVKPSARGLVTAGSKYEQWRIDRGTPDVPSPLIADGLVYLAGENGGLTCLDALTGKPYYQRKPTHGGLHRASPVLADGKLYLVARDGAVTVVAAGKAFKKLATNRLPDTFAASPAVSGGRIYLHGYKYLWAVGK